MQQWPLARGKLRKKVLHLLARGQVSRAVKLICSHSLADMYDPQIIDAMQAKYPERAGAACHGDCWPVCRQHERHEGEDDEPGAWGLARLWR